MGDYNQGSCKIETVRNTTLKIVDGGYLGNNKEVVIGKQDASSSGTDNGYLLQTGGQLNITGSGKLEIGYKAPTSGTDGGIYTISGGSLIGTSGRMYIGCSGATGSIGKFDVNGTGGTISLGGELYIANDSSTANNYTGTGTLQFDLNASGAVSKIQVLKTIIDSQGSSAATANLIVNLTGAAPSGNLLLVENTGTSSVVGLFDSLNGGSAAEGATVVLGGNTYTLTYMYDSVSGTKGLARSATYNDIALIPEPATIALLGLGLIAIRRKK
ncbi:MAG: PEP-CTERM sorting domain-containing protein [Sedimentisphaerales bacterium]